MIFSQIRIGVLFFATAAQGFLAPSTIIDSRQATVTYARARSSSVSVLKMSDEADAAPAGTTAQDISKGIAHPEAVFTVPENILKVLPHRYPFALVDKVLHFEPGKRIIGVKCITNNEPQFTGHFPDNPIMPGVLQVLYSTGFYCRGSKKTVGRILIRLNLGKVAEASSRSNY